VSSCSRLDATVDGNNHRSSTFQAFIPLQLAKDRKTNLHICTGALVRAIDVRDTAGGPKAVGVTVENETGGKDQYHISASREVIVCAGAIGTPQLLLLSGIGPAKDLNSLGIKLVADLPGVGAHLQDHASVPVVYKVPLSDSLERLMAKPLIAIQKLLEYIFTGKGLFGSQVQQANVVFLSNQLDENCHLTTPNETDNPIPDAEIMFLPINSTPRKFKGLAKSYGAFSYLCTVIQPASSGSLRLTSTEPRDQPACDPGILVETHDYEILRKAVRLAMALGQQSRQQGYPLEPVWVPEGSSDAALDAFIRRDVGTTYHYSSTCRMAPAGDMGVVDDELRVHGVGSLSIADASVFPRVLACHLQAPVVMVAERCADFLVKRHFGGL